MTVGNKIACVFGGTGFIGRQVVRELAKAGYSVKIATRVPERAFDLKTAGTVAQIVPVACHYGDDDSLAQAVRGCSVVVNCVGILFEKGKKSRFDTLHADLPGRIGAVCHAEGVDRLVHLSALGVDTSTSRYAASKRKGEEALTASFPAATILRPSVVFGPGDEFFSLFARLSVVSPALPLIGGGHTKFQPVYVGDVADAVLKSITLPADAVQGKIFELAGPEVITFREVYDRITAVTGRKPCLVSLPWGMAKVQGTVMSLLPRPLLTADQVESLKTDNVLTGKHPTLADLDVNQTAVGTILPSYLACYRVGGRFGDKKRA